ncbi:MAG: DUF1501 domain-containing protein [Limnohabitans sp.]
MRHSRREFLLGAGAVSMTSIGAALLPLSQVAAADYKAVVIVNLAGGFDGNNVLIPIDGAFSDYSKARPSLVLPKDSLLRLTGSHIGHTFALTPSVRPLFDLFERKRVAVVANVGALIQPTTIDQVRNRSVKLPPFLGSHSDQEQWIQGWMGDEDRSGWAGRTMDLMPSEVRSRQPLISVTNNYTALVSNSTPLSLADSNASSFWGMANIADPANSVTQRVEWASRLQSSNPYEAEFARSMRAAYLDSQEFAQGRLKGPVPTGDFPTASFSQFPRDLSFVAKHIGYSKAVGAQRQIYLVRDGGYDTHTGQPLDPAAGAGSDHAWGNHWFAMGGAVKGGTVYGSTFPTLQTGGPDDASLYNPKRGQWVPQFSSDQFVADAMRWLGLSADQTVAAMPNLANFKNRTIGYI